MNTQLVEALRMGLECAEQVLNERKAALAGYPHKWLADQECVDTIRAALIRAGERQADTAPNLACKSEQARLATQWGYVKQAVPLTEEQLAAIPCTDGDGSDWDALVRFARAIERAHGIESKS